MTENKDYKISEYDKLVIDIRNNVSTRLADLMSKLLNTAQDKLFDLSNEAESNEDQTRYFDLMNQIRILKPEIADAFNKKIKDYLVPAKDFKNQHEKKKQELNDELSLVDQDVMEGIVLVKGIGERSAAKYREQLSHLEARLEHLSLKTSTVFTQDALKPTNFCQAFGDSLSDDFSNDNKKLLFKMFDIEIANKLDALYDSINNRLIDAGILPQIKLHVKGQKQSPQKPRPQQPPQNAEDDAQQNINADDSHSGGYSGSAGSSQGNNSGSNSGSNYAGGQAGGANNSGVTGGGASTGGQNAGGSNISGFAMTAAPGGNYRHGNLAGNTEPESGETPPGNGHPPAGAGGTAGGAGNVPGGGSQTAAQKTQTGGGDGTAGSGEYQHYTAGMPASQVGRVLGNYIGAPFTPETADKSSQVHAEYFPESTPQHFGHQEILQALSSVQHLPQFEHPQENRFDGEAIKKAVLEEFAKTSGGAVTKRINQIAEKTIDFIELIFDAIIDDDDISDTIKTLLLRLQIPIIKASMSDQEFFIYDDHPARVLLDSIAEIGIGVTEHSDTVYIQLDKIISFILGEHNLTTETFQKALDSLNSYIEEQEAIARAKEEAEQDQILRSHARSTVLKALRATTSGKSLPEAVHPLILKRWPTFMFNHYLSNGKENNEWINLVLTLRHIVESVQPIKSAESLAKILDEKDELFATTEKYLNVTSNSKKDVETVIQTYKNTVQQHIDDANFTEQEIDIAEEVRSHAEPAEEAPVEEASEKHEIPANVMPGMWFQIYMGEGHVARRCKLSVIIVEDANMMFVNHKGELVAEKTFDEFNQEVAENKTKMIMGHSAFDHAFKAVINRLN